MSNNENKTTENTNPEGLQPALGSIVENLLSQARERAKGQVNHMLTYCVDFNPRAYQHAYEALIQEQDPSEFEVFARQSTFLGACREPLIERWVRELKEAKQTRWSEKQMAQIVEVFKNAEFLEKTLCELFSKFEGTACSADKARTVLRSWTQHLMEPGQKIQWDYQAKYTYHLPKTILVEHTSIEKFFSSAIQLLHGRPWAFTQFVGELQESNTP